MGKHSLSQILLSVVFKDLAELNPREDFSQKSIEMERNLCHILIPAHLFRTCTSQEKGASPVSIDTKTQVQDVCICSRSEGPGLHTHSASLTVRGVRQWGILLWQPEVVVLASGCRPYSASISDLEGKREGSCGKSSLIYVVSYSDKNTN